MKPHRNIYRTLLVILAVILAVGPMLTVSEPTAPVHAAPDTVTAPYTVDILVVDNFSTTQTASGAAEDNCAINTEGQGFAVRGAGFATRGAGFATRGAGFATRGAGFATRGAGFATRGAGFATRGAGFATRGAGFATRGAGFATRGADGQMQIDVPHGKIVAWQLEELDYWYGDDVDVNIVEVRMADYRTDFIASQLEKAVNQSTADFIVVNMSFAIVPCGMVDTFEEYLDELNDSDNFNDVLELQAMLDELLSTTYDPDAIAQQVLEDDLNQMFAANIGRVFAVASAGNFGLPFPFYPAGWDNIISVSGSEAYFDFYEPDSFEPDTTYPLLGFGLVENGLSDRPISNYGEIMMPGQYYDIIGASYAAPRLSYLIGHYLAQAGSDYCRTGDGDFALVHGGAANLTFDEAASAHCPDMLDYVPEEIPFDLDGDGLVAFTTFLEAEDLEANLISGSWDTIEADFASGGAFLDTGWFPWNDRIEIEFAGPFVEVHYIDGWTLGLLRAEVDNSVRRSAFTLPWFTPTSEVLLINNLSDSSHMLEIYPRFGWAAVDGIYTTIFVPDPFAEGND
jgi:hypothetical protein